MHRVTAITFKQHVETLYRPLLASLVMAVAVITMNVLPLSGSYRLGADIVLGGSVFLGSSWVLWNAAGRPASPEADIFTIMARIFGQFAGVRATREDIRPRAGRDTLNIPEAHGSNGVS